MEFFMIVEDERYHRFFEEMLEDSKSFHMT